MADIKPAIVVCHNDKNVWPVDFLTYLDLHWLKSAYAQKHCHGLNPFEDYSFHLTKVEKVKRRPGESEMHGLYIY